MKRKGFKILQTNYKTYIGEIDIIGLDADTVVFVEVKTRLNDEFGAPSEAVTARKREKYYKVATEYLIRNKLCDKPCRFDVIEIENGEINHISDAFYM